MQCLRIDVVIDIQLEMLALPHVAHPPQAHPGQRAHDRLTLRIEDFRLGYDVNDHSRHDAEATVFDRFVARSSVGTPAALAISWNNASLAAPSLGAARTRALSTL